MKTSALIFSAVLMLALTASAQEQTPTVEEIYTKYLHAIGGNEKIKNVENKMDVTLISTEYVTTGEISNQGTAKQEVINYWDYVNVQSATVNKQYPSELTGDKITFTRYLVANGKTTIMLPDGKKQESTSLHTGFEEAPFPETTVPPGAKLLPNETFNGKEVYVVSYEKSTIGTPFQCIAYFDIASGLLEASTQINKEENYGSNMTTKSLNIYENYKEVDGMLLPHRIKMTIDHETTGALNMKTVTNITMESIAIEFNINMEDFKNGCFQNPEDCFAKYGAK